MLGEEVRPVGAPRGLHAYPCVTMVMQLVFCVKASCGVVFCMNGQLSPQFALHLVLLGQIFGLYYALTMFFMTVLCIIGAWVAMFFMTVLCTSMHHD